MAAPRLANLPPPDSASCRQRGPRRAFQRKEPLRQVSPAALRGAAVTKRCLLGETKGGRTSGKPRHLPATSHPLRTSGAVHRARQSPAAPQRAELPGPRLGTDAARPKANSPREAGSQGPPRESESSRRLACDGIKVGTGKYGRKYGRKRGNKQPDAGGSSRRALRGAMAVFGETPHDPRGPPEEPSSGRRAAAGEASWSGAGLATCRDSGREGGRRQGGRRGTEPAAGFNARFRAWHGPGDPPGDPPSSSRPILGGF